MSYGKKAMCWEILGSGIHMDVTLTLTTYLDMVADQAQPSMVTVP